MEKKKTRKIIKYFAIIILIILVLNLALFFSGRKVDEEIVKEEKINFIKNENLTSVDMFLPAVDANGKGVLTKLNVEARKGHGKTLISIENLLFFADTQQSIRIARLVAQDITQMNLSDYDLVYDLKANASVIGGPSAGAALTLATIAALTGEKPREDVMISGSINRDGSIGPVSDILEKARASTKYAKLFLVPLLQSRDVIYETSEYCEKFGVGEVCTTETKPKKINITQETGIEVEEVENIKEAMKYFFE